MDDLKPTIMREYARAIMHMREQMRLRRFGLIFGAGISQDFGFPSWQELISRIAKDKRVGGKYILDKAGAKTSVSQLLFQNYRAKLLRTLGPDYDQYDRRSSRIQSGWHEIVNKALYHGVPKDAKSLRKKDPYLYEYVPIIKTTPLTVNYNFDDTLQCLLSESRTEDERREKRGFRTVWSTNIQLYPQDGVIYHPNGYLPRDFRERPSEDLIFLEDSFGDQLLGSVSGHYAALSYHLSQNTCLFIGLSLDDSTLKHLLRKNAHLHPGHVHYYVHFLNDSNALSDGHKTAIRDANFEVYNLITLFLTREGIAALGRMLSTEDEEVSRIANDIGVPTAFRFFLTGSVCVGKSTAVSHFRSLLTHDEWLEQKERGMERDPSLVKEKGAIRRIDEWVANQWHLKNFTLSREATRGIHIIDRCPLDAFAFTPEREWIKKAKFTKKKITPRSSSTPLCKGRVVLLLGDPDVMAVRAIKLQKEVTPEKLRERQRLLQVIYDKSNVPGVFELDTCEKSVERVAKEICRIIHIENYEECDLQGRLDGIESGLVQP